MNIIVAPDGFKDSLEAKAVCNAMLNGIAAFNPQAKAYAIYASDGGDGFLNAVKHYKPELETVHTVTQDPLGRSILADYLWDTKNFIAYIELAAASGIELLSSQERQVMDTSTYGTGLQIQNAIARGAEKIYVGLGGSATNDAATGLAAALGYVFKDSYGNPIVPCGKKLIDIQSIFCPNSIPEKVKVIAVNDVQNPLYGAQGAAFTYAAQKGASTTEIDQLDQGLRALNNVVLNDLKRDVAHLLGAGAAGGTGYGLKVFLNAEFISGTHFILGLSDFFDRIDSQQIDLILTGEGCIDNQTANGKLIHGLIGIGTARNIPVMAVCGKLNLSPDQVKNLGLKDAVELYQATKPKDYSYTHAARLVVERTTQMLSKHY